MKNIKLAIRSFFRKGNGNLIKVLSLGTGLAIGIVLIAKVCFEMSYDKFYADSDRIYLIMTGYSSNGGRDDSSFGQISGAVAPGFKSFIPAVEEATRITNWFQSESFFTSEKKKFSGQLELADSNFFKVFPREILAGDPAKILGQPFHAMVSRSFAEKFGGMAQAIGQQLYNDEQPNWTFTIDGVYEDFPENGSFHFDILLSMETYPEHSRLNWMGNDRYRGYVKLTPGTDPASLKPAIRQMQEANQEIERLEQNGATLWYFLEPFDTLHTSDPSVQNMNILLALLAFALIFTAVMNYILIVISSLVRRTKEVGVRKCYGAEGGNIRSIMMSETTLHLVLSLIISAALILAFRGIIEELLDASLGALFLPETIWILVGVCVIVYLVSGLIPSYLFMNIPVATVFRNYKESKRQWKLILLFFQFTATALLCTLLIIIGKQYDKMAHDKPGYEYENIIYTEIKGVPENEVMHLVDLLKAQSNVADVESTWSIPIDGSSGNNVRFPGEDKDLFNIADQYDATEGFFDMMGFKLIAGRAPVGPKDVAVSRSFVDKMDQFADWSDGAVGKSIILSEHSQGNMDVFTICGVYENYRIGSITDEDTRPSVRFCEQKWSKMYLVIKLHSFDYKSMKETSKIIQDALPNKDVVVKAYREEMRNLYNGSRKFRDAVLIGGLITLIIALIGLIGYTNDETNRRSAEIAVRKINGAVVPEILSLFIKDILRTSLPAVIIGNIAAIFVANKWMEQFSEKITLSPWIFILSGIAVMIIILAVVIIDCLKIANSNPVDSLKNE